MESLQCYIQSCAFPAGFPTGAAQFFSFPECAACRPKGLRGRVHTKPTVLQRFDKNRVLGWRGGNADCVELTTNDEREQENAIKIPLKHRQASLLWRWSHALRRCHCSVREVSIVHVGGRMVRVNHLLNTDDRAVVDVSPP